MSESERVRKGFIEDTRHISCKSVRPNQRGGGGGTRGQNGCPDRFTHNREQKLKKKTPAVAVVVVDD